MDVIFYFFGLISIIMTLLVITNKQPIHALLYLITSFLSISCIFFSLGDDFAGALEIIIYAGAIMVLFVFVIMILNITVFNEINKNVLFSPKIWMGQFIISLMLLLVLVYAVYYSTNSNYYITENLITIKSIGITLFKKYALSIEIASVLLLSSLIVSFHLGKYKK